ncbi:putative stem-specific protein TSJT1 [Helianthus annuus]|nr:putative stem-specific protein TSJT1 [Helianthus annuus]KAJ0625760.1 putative stem-specific protein TSJT1 [Helianthus annuus]KAJ0782131.1 putative stem-specific protein TSJT1 [Helianthus annuus]
MNILHLFIIFLCNTIHIDIYISCQENMLGVFKNGLVSAPKELNSPSSSFHQHEEDQDQHPLKHFLKSYTNAFSISFGNDVSLALDPSSQVPLFCSMDDIYCIFLGGLNNLCTLNKQYGLTKVANEPMFVIQAYKTLRDRGPYPAHSVLKELDGSFGFILYDVMSKTVFVSLGANGEVKLFWGIAADGSVVISDNLVAIKSSCSKSFAPFPTGCMYHTEGGLISFEHPKKKMKAISRVDSEGVMCGATFKVDMYSKTQTMPRVGSEANWATWGV